MRRFFAELLRPSRTARAIPLGRLAIGSMLVFVVLFVLFTLSSMGVQLPFISHPYVVKAWFQNAAGLDPSNGPQVSVAGVPEGQVTAVRYAAGRALVTMSLSGDARGRVFRDATVRVRPFNGANFLQVDIDPGSPAAGSLPAGATIDASRTSIPVATDQVFDVLDADTRAYLQVLTEEAATSLHGAGGTLSSALQRLAPLSGEARQIGAMLASRDRLLSKLVRESNSIFGTLGGRRAELARVVATASKILSVTGSRTAEIAAATRRLPAVIDEGGAASQAISSAAPDLEQALTRLAPAATAFAGGLRDTQRATGALGQLLGAISTLVRGTSVPSSELTSLTAHLGDGVGQAIAGYQSLTQIMQALIAHEQPISEFSAAVAGEFSTQDSYGVLGRVKLLGIQTPTPEDLGLPSSAARVPGGGSRHSQLQLMLASALARLCRGAQPLACVLAVATPGLPGSLVKRLPTPGGAR